MNHHLMSCIQTNLISTSSIGTITVIRDIIIALSNNQKSQVVPLEKEWYINFNLNLT
jgi:hypothetical protein